MSYYGVLAPAAAKREQIVPGHPERKACHDAKVEAGDERNRGQRQADDPWPHAIEQQAAAALSETVLRAQIEASEHPPPGSGVPG